MTSSEIDDTFFAAAANTSDETVPTSTGTQTRYTANGVITLDQNPRTNIKALLSAGGGALVPLIEGKARLFPGAYSTPTVTLTEDDLRDKYTYTPHTALKDVFNTVHGMYAGPETGWQTVSYPQVGNSAYVTQDNGHRHQATT